MKLLIGLAVSFGIGALCRYFGLPVPSPPVLPGALLVLAMTLGYSLAGRALDNDGSSQSKAQHQSAVHPRGIPGKTRTQ